MHKRMRSIRNVGDKTGTSLDCVLLTVRAHFNPEEPQDIVDRVADLEFDVGDLQFEDNGNSQVLSRARGRATQIVASGGIQTTMRLSGPSAFTLISAVKEIQVNKAD